MLKEDKENLKLWKKGLVKGPASLKINMDLAQKMIQSKQRIRICVVRLKSGQVFARNLFLLLETHLFK